MHISQFSSEIWFEAHLDVQLVCCFVFTKFKYLEVMAWTNVTVLLYSAWICLCWKISTINYLWYQRLFRQYSAQSQSLTVPALDIEMFIWSLNLLHYNLRVWITHKSVFLITHNTCSQHYFHYITGPGVADMSRKANLLLFHWSENTTNIQKGWEKDDICQSCSK